MADSNLVAILAFIKVEMETIPGIGKVFIVSRRLRSQGDIRNLLTENNEEIWWTILRTSFLNEDFDVEGTILRTHIITVRGHTHFDDQADYVGSTEEQHNELLELISDKFGSSGKFDSVANAGRFEPPQLPINEKRSFVSPNERILHFGEIILSPRECIPTSL